MKRFSFLFFVLSLAFAATAWADGTIESTFKTGGIKGMGASEGATTRRYQGDKMWESVSSKFTGAILSRVAGGTDSIMITRVDKGVFWTLDPKNRTYTERGIEPLRPKESAKEPEKEKPKTRVTKSDFSVKQTGKSETINGFPCEEYLITWLLELEDVDTKAKSTSTMATNLWTTSETAAIRSAQNAEAEFSRAYARKIGVALSPEESKQLGMAAVAGMFGMPSEEIEKGLQSVKGEMAKVKGYPIRTVVTWTAESEKTAAREETPQKESPLDTSGGVKGILGGLMGRMVQKKVEEKTSSLSGKDAPFFNSIMEVKAIQSEPVPPTTFEIPEGYAKK